MVLIRRLW